MSTDAQKLINLSLVKLNSYNMSCNLLKYVLVSSVMHNARATENKRIRILSRLKIVRLFRGKMITLH